MAKINSSYLLDNLNHLNIPLCRKCFEGTENPKKIIFVLFHLILNRMHNLKDIHFCIGPQSLVFLA